MLGCTWHVESPALYEIATRHLRRAEWVHRVWWVANWLSHA
jgi:hypothetical protein